VLDEEVAAEALIESTEGGDEIGLAHRSGRVPESRIDNEEGYHSSDAVAVCRGRISGCQ
jgi:hypothetical protein